MYSKILSLNYASLCPQRDSFELGRCVLFIWASAWDMLPPFSVEIHKNTSVIYGTKSGEFGKMSDIASDDGK